MERQDASRHPYSPRHGIVSPCKVLWFNESLFLCGPAFPISHVPRTPSHLFCSQNNKWKFPQSCTTKEYFLKIKQITNHDSSMTTVKPIMPNSKNCLGINEIQKNRMQHNEKPKKIMNSKCNKSERWLGLVLDVFNEQSRRNNAQSSCTIWPRTFQTPTDPK